MAFQSSRSVLRAVAAERRRLCVEPREGNLLIDLSNLLKRIRNLPLRDESNSDSVVNEPSGGSSVEILAELAHLLECDSRHARHLACAILVAVSQYLSSSLEEWEAFIRSLFVALEIVVMKSTQTHRSFPSLKSALQNSTSSTATCILEVLCNAFKCIKREPPRSQVFFVSLSSFLQNNQWERLKSFHKRNDCLNNLLRLLCSVLGQTDVSATFVSSVANTLPHLIGYCCDSGVTYYTRHKLLMIMVRLTDQTSVDFSSFLHLLHRYFDDVLMEPMTNNKIVKDQSFEESPFVCSQVHLQRSAVIIFLRVCFGGMRVSNGDGFHEIDKWVKHQTTGVENRLDFCRDFVGLYINEDGLLFAVLLELLSIHGFINKLGKGEGDTCEKERLSWRFDYAFNPVVLFEMFLEGVKYDHQVVVDYLISKDSGIRCAEYLLKCLRAVCESWPVVADVSVGEAVPSKKRKGCGQFHDGKTCLVSLKRSVEKLHQKKLFPYNPRPLLKRLEQFESLSAVE